jgi:hypothetical protein
MNRLRSLCVATLLGLPLLACTQKDECEACSADRDCRSGFVCSNFDDGGRRCASGTGATSCAMRP